MRNGGSTHSTSTDGPDLRLLRGQRNRQTVLDAIGAKPGCSRGDVRRVTGLSSAAVCRHVNAAIDSGAVSWDYIGGVRLWFEGAK